MQEPVKIKLTAEELQAAAEREEDIARRLGKGSDGSFAIIEMNRATGEQTLISSPNLALPIVDADGKPQTDPGTGGPVYRWQVLLFPSEGLARGWVAERGEVGYGYLILKAVGSASGTKTAEELVALAEQDESSLTEE